MEESNYKHNYEYLSIEEAKTIVNGTFVQGTTNIGGELATKYDIDHLVDNANKRLTSIVPVTDTSNEFICFFECEDIETFPDEWTYVFHYDVSGTSGSSSTPTSWTKQYNVDGQQINNNLVLNGITSYKIKTGSLGTVQRENVSYSGQVGSPSGYNYSEQEATGSGHLTQDGSGKQLQWSYTQNANVKVWNISADKTSLSFPANGGTRSVQITTWYTWQYNNNNNQKFDQNTTTENITAEANTLQQQKTWTKVITKNNKSVSIQCTQEGAQEQFPDDLQHRWIRVQPENSQISVDGGTINVTGSYGLTGTFGTERKIGDITDTIVVESNSTQGQKSGSKTYHYNNNQSDTPTAKITWTQPGRAEEFPDDEAHRWIEITPTDAGNFTEAGGTITVTGSYGLTGSFGTKKTVGQINDTITVERNTTTQAKSGSKTYYYNNASGTTPSATVTWTQDAHIEQFTYTYELKLGTEQNNLLDDDVIIQFQADEVNVTKHIYYSCIRNKINEAGEIVQSEPFDTEISYQESDNVTYSKLEAYTLDITQKKSNNSYTENIILKASLNVTGYSGIKHNITVVLLSKNSINLVGDVGIFYTDYNREENKKYSNLQTYCRTTLPNPRKSQIGSLSTNFAPGVLTIPEIGYYNNAFMAKYVGGNSITTEDQVTKILIDFKKIRKTILDGKNVDVMKSFLEQDTPSFTFEFLQYWNTIGDASDKILYNVYFNQKYYNEVTNPSIKIDDKTKDFILTGYNEINSQSKRLPVEQYAAFWGNYSIDGHIQHATSIVKITYYLNKSLSSFTASVETNYGNVGKWNKGIRTKYCGNFKVSDTFCSIIDDDNQIILDTTIKGISNDKYTFVTGDKFDVRYSLMCSNTSGTSWAIIITEPISGGKKNFTYDSQTNVYTCRTIFDKQSLIKKIKEYKDFKDSPVVYLRGHFIIDTAYYYDKYIEIGSYYTNPKQVEFKLFL